MGTTAAYSLAREEANEVTIVDRSPDVLREFQERLDARTVLGHAAHPDVLERAGAGDAEMIIALTDSDEINMVACQVAASLFGKRLARSRGSARASTPRTGSLFRPDGIPVDIIISPEQLVTAHIDELIHFPGALQVLEFSEGRVRLVAARAHEGGALINRPRCASSRNTSPTWSAVSQRSTATGKSISPDRGYGGDGGR